MRVDHFDVIVIGAGPGGATAAFELAKAGIKTLPIEKQKLPRHKTCGGGLTYKVTKALTFDISSVVERTITNFVLTYRLSHPRVVKSPNPLVYMIRRSEFDNLLTNSAVNAGAQLMDETKVEDISADDLFKVSTSQGMYTADFLIGADGATGITARPRHATCLLWLGLSEGGSLQCWRRRVWPPHRLRPVPEALQYRTSQPARAGESARAKDLRLRAATPEEECADSKRSCLVNWRRGRVSRSLNR